MLTFKPKLLRFLFLIIFIVTSLFAQAQKQPLKIGKIDKKILENTFYKNDSSANAVILSDYGRSYFEFDNKGDLHLYFVRQVRVKILNKNGFDWADWEVVLYKTKSNVRDKLLKVKGYTYNLVNGEVEKTKFENEVFETSLDMYHNIAKFTFPKVKEGSVIDLEYKVSSPFFGNIDPWYFQYDIPVLRSEYYFEYPEFIIYSKFMKGYVPLTKVENNTRNLTVTIFNRNRSSGNYMQTTNTSNQVDVLVYSDHYISEKVPAFIEEQPLSSKKNYISKVEYEIARIDPKFSFTKNFSTTWPEINTVLVNDDDFGYELKRSRDIYDILMPVSNAILQDYSSDIEKMIAAYNHIYNRMNWDLNISIAVNSSLKNLYLQQNGNVTEINLILVALLRDLGIEAYPLVGCSKSTGFLLKSQPKLSQLNYVTVLAIIDGKKYLMDATAAYVPCGMLPERALNKQAWLVDETKSGWVDLTPNKKFKTYEMINVTMNENGDLQGELQGSYSDYAAVEMRSEISKLGSEEEFIKSIIDQYDGFSFESFEIIDLKNIYKPVKSKIKVSVASQVMNAGDRIYFNPMMFDKITENPFKLKERLYPVEYDYKEDVTYMLNLTIPPGYTVEEVPENIKVALPEQGGTFAYQIKKVGSMLQIISQLKISKMLFPSDEYDYLKEFYEMIMNKHAEQIVLVKT